ncbi:hypothetical protein HHL16_18270 [Pseudoflavitalea sp. G-6-1-2]|uniref:hypothetical protein n=1 Tax=Pseudoflavitalea sp. G-6-1-2 TaxID=2728841 RepID=UPI00146C9633|nr:hypothetical protein [Pseudoflavitalea sp. G-6-1-2]NML22837.1 hypothetical protein [Pseudoflavitalea sp. G-6-1-2]
MKPILTVVLLFIAMNCFAQADTKVLGTFSAGCKVFNYDFRKSTKGIYTFKVDLVDEEEGRIYFDKDSLTQLKNNLQKIVDSLDVLDSLLHEERTLSDGIKDTIKNVVASYQKIVDSIYNDHADLAYWKAQQGPLRAMLQLASKLELNKYDSLLGRYGDIAVMSKFNQATGVILNSINGLSETRSYTLNEFKQESFIPLANAIINKKKALFLPECATETNPNTIALNLFYEIKARLDFKDDEPITAYLKLRSSNIKCYYNKSGKLNRVLKKDSSILPLANKFSIDNVSVEFEDGAIKNLFADLLVLDEKGQPIVEFPVRFKNPTPISISARNDKDKIGDKLMYALDLGKLREKLIPERVQSGNKISLRFVVKDSFSTEITVEKKFDYSNICFPLSELLEYADVLEIDKEDYSPVNSVVNLSPKSPVVELKKEKRSKILTVKTFTDLVGVQGDQPNGLIQIEASRKFNLWTARIGSKYFYYGALTYLEPRAVMSKIEQNKRDFILTAENIDQDELARSGKKKFNMRAIDLFKYQSFAFDVDLNLGKVNMPNVKSNIQVNMNAGILRTNVSDTLDVLNGALVKAAAPIHKILNTFRWGFSLLYELKPDTRYGLVLGYDYRKYSLLSEDYFLIDSKNDVIHSIWADAHLKTNDNSKLFFRFKTSVATPAKKQNFVQIQLGYLLDIFKVSSK